MQFSCAAFHSGTSAIVAKDHSDNARMVCSSAAHALGELSARSTHVDPLFGDLCTTLRVADGGIKVLMLGFLLIKDLIVDSGNVMEPKSLIDSSENNFKTVHCLLIHWIMRSILMSEIMKLKVSQYIQMKALL